MNEAELLPCNLDSKHGEEPKLHQIQSSQKENHHTLPPIIIHLSVTWTPYSITIPTRRSFLFPGSGTPLFTIRWWEEGSMVLEGYLLFSLCHGESMWNPYTRFMMKNTWVADHIGSCGRSIGKAKSQTPKPDPIMTKKRFFGFFFGGPRWFQLRFSDEFFEENVLIQRSLLKLTVRVGCFQPQNYDGVFLVFFVHTTDMDMCQPLHPFVWVATWKGVCCLFCRSPQKNKTRSKGSFGIRF